MPDIRKASQEKEANNTDTKADVSIDVFNDINIRKNRDFSNDPEADREEHYTKKGHQVMIQAMIGGKLGKRDTVNIDLWYNNAYELYASRWNLKDFAKMQDVFHRHVKVQF